MRAFGARSNPLRATPLSTLRNPRGTTGRRCKHHKIEIMIRMCNKFYCWKGPVWGQYYLHYREDIKHYQQFSSTSPPQLFLSQSGATLDKWACKRAKIGPVDEFLNSSQYPISRCRLQRGEHNCPRPWVLLNVGHKELIAYVDPNLPYANLIVNITETMIEGDVSMPRLCYRGHLIAMWKWPMEWINLKIVFPQLWSLISSMKDALW